MATQGYCARLLGISERRFRELIDEQILPRAEKGGYDIEIIVPAYCSHLREIAAGRGGGEGQANKATEDARYARARADKAEMEAAQMRGELVPAAQIADALHSAVLIMKTRLIGLPPKIAPLVIGNTSIPVSERVIRDNIEEALAELAKIEVRASSAD